jgi:hypothetical protein
MITNNDTLKEKGMRKRDAKGHYIKDGTFPRYKKCKECGSVFYCRSWFKYDTSTVCSYNCRDLMLSKTKTGKTPYKMTQAIRDKITKAKKGLRIWGGKREMPWLVGEKNPNWKGGVTDESVKLRKSPAWKCWRDNVFTRDNFTCLLCGKNGKYLHPHHIKSFTLYTNDRFMLDNGMTVCKDCHYLIHSNNELKNIYYMRGGDFT